MSAHVEDEIDFQEFEELHYVSCQGIVYRELRDVKPGHFEAGLGCLKNLVRQRHSADGTSASFLEARRAAEQ